MAPTTPQSLAQSLKETTEREAPLLGAMTEAKAAERPTATSWSRKEELGHLLDSAVNNHVRFVRASLEEEFQGAGYEQDGWVRAHGYHDLPWATLVDLWQRHNELLCEVVKRIAPAKLATPCKIGGNSPVTLGFLIEDYILHMQHHLDHVLGRAQITSYPSSKLAGKQPD